MQKWKKDPKLYNAPTKEENNQIKKELDYKTTYVKEFLDSDPLRDWESFERCKWLWEWCFDKIYEGVSYSIGPMSVLDCGTKDCQFPEWLEGRGHEAIGIEISKKYYQYALDKGRPIEYEDVCNMTYKDNSFDFVFSHHLLGLVPDNRKALDEMFRVTSTYMVTLCQIPGNPKKHFAYMRNAKIFNEFIEDNKDKIKVWNNSYVETGYSNEWILLMEKKNGYEY